MTIEWSDACIDIADKYSWCYHDYVYLNVIARHLRRRTETHRPWIKSDWGTGTSGAWKRERVELCMHVWTRRPGRCDVNGRAASLNTYTGTDIPQSPVPRGMQYLYPLTSTVSSLSLGFLLLVFRAPGADASHGEVTGPNGRGSCRPNHNNSRRIVTKDLRLRRKFGIQVGITKPRASPESVVHVLFRLLISRYAHSDWLARCG